MSVSNDAISKAMGVVTVALVLALGTGLAAQSALMQLGLTETAARNFLLEEVKNPARDRRSDIVIAGTRAFLKLPPSARAAAATALFAWAKAYVNSPAFTANYAKERNNRVPQAKQYDLTVEQSVKRDLDEQLAAVQRTRQAVETFPPEDRASILEANEAEKSLKDPAYIKELQAQLAAQRAEESGNDAALAAKVEETMPADPKKLFAHRLREFLDATADGTVMTWGPMTRALRPAPVPSLVPGVRGIRAIAAGMGHVVALTEAGTVMTWGDNTHYDLGRGRNTTVSPAVVNGLTGVQSIAACVSASTAVLASGRIMTWGIVRPWTRPDSGGDGYSPFPILLWLDGLEQPSKEGDSR